MTLVQWSSESPQRHHLTVYENHTFVSHTQESDSECGTSNLRFEQAFRVHFLGFLKQIATKGMTSHLRDGWIDDPEASKSEPQVFLGPCSPGSSKDKSLLA